MLKVKKGYFANQDHSKKVPVIAESMYPSKPIDMLIGGGITICGIAYLMVSAFKHGVDCLGEADIDALREIDAIDREEPSGKP